MNVGDVVSVKYRLYTEERGIDYLVEITDIEDNKISGTVLADAYLFKAGNPIDLPFRSIISVVPAERPVTFKDGDEVYYRRDDKTLRRVQGEWYLTTKNTDESVKMYLDCGTFEKVES